MQHLKYLTGYSAQLLAQAGQLLVENRLSSILKQKYPLAHEIRTDRALYAYTIEMKNEFLRTAQPLSRVTYDGKMHLLLDALGSNTFVSRVQGGRLRAKNEIRIASVFRDAPAAFLKMIVVHELAHLKEKSHDKAFYKLCLHMEPAYHQLEFDARLYLTQLDYEQGRGDVS